MPSFYHLFDDFVEHLKIKQYSIKKKRTETKNIIKIYCKSKDRNVSKELNFLNCLYYRHNLKEYGYNLFTVTEAISLSGDYFYTYIFSSSKQ